MKELFVKLTLAERFALIPRLPQKGSYPTMARARELQEKLIPTPEEETKFKIKDDARTGRTSWAPEARLATVEIAIGETMNDKIKGKLMELHKAGELTGVDVTLYEKFVKAAEPVGDEKPEDPNDKPKASNGKTIGSPSPRP